MLKEIVTLVPQSFFYGGFKGREQVNGRKGTYIGIIRAGHVDVIANDTRKESRSQNLHSKLI